MQKFVQYILVLSFVACIAACGGGAITATPIYKLPKVFASYSASKPHLMGGAIQGTPLVIGNPAKVSTLAGTAGPPLDGGISFANYSGNSSVTARFNQPNDVTTDGTDFYVADYWNNAIRLIHTDTVSGVVKTSTLQCIDKISRAAVGFSFPSGITTDGTYLYVVDRGFNCIRVITIALVPNTNVHEVITIGNASGLAGSVDSTDRTAVLFNQPTGITTDGVNVYVADYANATVRWIDTSDHLNNNYAVYTLAGVSGAIGSTDGTTLAALFYWPTRITTDGTNLYVTDVLNRTIRQIVIATGQVTTLAGSAGQLGPDGGTLNGTGTAASFRGPNGITTDGTNLYMTDTYLAIIRKIVITTGAVTTLPLPPGSLLGPLGITTDGVSLFVADAYLVSPAGGTAVAYTFSNSILQVQ